MYTQIRTAEAFAEWTPLPLAVYCWVQPTARNQLTTPMLTRVGAARDEGHARELIAQDKAAMARTFGGLFSAPGTSGRHYRVFRAAFTSVEL